MVKTSFDRASLIEKSKEPKTAALMIGVQSFDGMTQSDARNYATHLGHTLQQLRANNIPVVWAAIDSEKGNQAYIPDANANGDALLQEKLRELGFEGFDNNQSNRDIFTQFMQEHGPRENEAVFRKSFMSALVDESDIEHSNRADHQRALLLQAGVILDDSYKPENPEYFRQIDPDDADAEFTNFFRNEKTVTDYLREQDVGNTLIMGQVAYYCVLETAVSAATKGFNPTIVNDRCLGWVYPFDPTTNTEHRVCVWQEAVDENGNYFDVDFSHRESIRNRIENILQHETEERGFSEQDHQAVNAMNIEDFSKVAERLKITQNIEAAPVYSGITPPTRN